MNYYNVFGLKCLSEIPLKAFKSINSIEKGKEDFVVLEKDLSKVVLNEEILKENKVFTFTKKSILIKISGKANFLVSNGNKIEIDFFTKEKDEALLYFYTNAIAAILFQRNKIPFHVSGVYNSNNKVWLFAGESKAGKSSTVIKLKELGYETFTDDTALIYFDNDNKCIATPSYPMVRIREETVSKQNVYDLEGAKVINDEYKKYGVFIHETFRSEEAEVEGIVFLNKKGKDIGIKKLKAIEGFDKIIKNVYRFKWVNVLKKQKIQHKIISEIVKKDVFWEASRPEDKDTFDSFSSMISTTMKTFLK